MAELFLKQAQPYSEGRPSYPQDLFQFIASKSPIHDLAWDVGTGNGQAAKSLAEIYKNVIATDTSKKQLEFAPKLPNIRYHCTPPTMSMDELEINVAAKGSVDLVTIAQAMHWFDLPTFYQQVKWILKNPQGLIAAWCYTTPEVNNSVDSVLLPYYSIECAPYWDPVRQLVDEKYTTINFPFEPVDGLNGTGPFEFMIEKVMDLDGYITYLRSWSAYQIARDKGVELLTEDVVEDFKRAWSEDDNSQNVVKFPIYLRFGKVGN